MNVIKSAAPYLAVVLLLGFGGGYAVARVISDDSSETKTAMDDHSHDSSDEAMDSHMHEMFMVSAEQAPKVTLDVEEDAKSGWNVHIMTENFTFTPEKVNGDNVVGEGHAHLYVDGEKVARVYGNYFHYDGSFDGTKEFKVTLNANDHSEYSVGEQVISATQTVTHRH